MSSRLLLSALVLLVVPAAQGCGPVLEIPERDSPDASTIAVVFEPDECCELPGDFRFSVGGGVRAPFPMLFQGELSDYHRARLDNDELSSTLEARRVPLGFEARKDERVYAALESLDGDVYSLATSEKDVVEIDVTIPDGPSFSRVWPTDSEPTRFAVFCSSEAKRGTEVKLSDGVEAFVVPGHNECFGLKRDTGGSDAFSPRTLFGATVQTTVLTGTTSRSNEPLTLDCTERESRFAIGCAEVLDDRVVFRSPVDSYWLFPGLGASAMVSVEGQASVSGLVPGRTQELTVLVFTRGGTELSTTLAVTTAAPRVHLVINEVLANPLGPEPDQEWVELYNDGAEAVDVEGFTLSDSSGERVALPARVMPPRSFVVLVNEGFDVSSTWDVPVPEDTLVRLSELGSRGLSNSGEPLELRSAEGLVLSTFPPRSAQPGVSEARLSPDCPDVAECFDSHAAPGASPGAINAFP